ncbi:MAG: hypothetical protein RIE52_11960 [Balneola sp.]
MIKIESLLPLSERELKKAQYVAEQIALERKVTERVNELHNEGSTKIAAIYKTAEEMNKSEYTVRKIYYTNQN